MSADVVAVARALDFAARKHAGQRRKGQAAEPYVNHLADVARMVAEATGGKDAVAVVAALLHDTIALLHDTIEDTGTTRQELEFGPEVAALVAEVTDDKTLPKAERKRLQVVHAPGKSARARMIKLADETSDLRSITASPPLGWDWQRQRDYFEWAGQVAQGCRGVNPTLEK